MDPSSPTLILDHVSKSFGDFKAVSDLSLQVRPGRVFGLIGPNGAGKTTTIRMIVNITAPDTGTIKLFGKSMTTALQDRIGYLPEERGLYRKMKVGEQLRFFAELKDLPGREADKRIDAFRFTTSPAARKKRLDLTGWKDKRAKDLSKGMQQKIQFIASVIHEPDLLILDEPFSGLDPVSVDLMKETILDQKTSGKTIILSTHQMEIAERLCDDICMINKSRKLFDGQLREVRRSFAQNVVALRVEGADGLLNDPELITNVRQKGDDTEVLLTADASPQVLLKRLVDANVKIAKFELVEPTLHDIFVAKVKESA